ncbi:GNAT family N-acetyltransferase [Pseudobacillus badius]|uniref:GNAT family N-acetyltransferase n=1 Tax=Bacillus badius TaxID=1455 RepID=UPI0005970BF1|nr:GNAT family protein [Bacillus badius]KIL74475.1 Ribosomal-protein-alanine acetyltransferase [Bacillus badius]KZR58866.1 acetyltransferase [Bacillus badius]
MEIYLDRLQAADAEALYQFELENRAFFEQMVPARGEDYYILEMFNKRHEALLEEQAQGGSYFYLIKGKDHSILGRINLVDIDKSHTTAHVGYRVGQKHTGKGITNQALKLLIETVKAKGIKQIQAKTTANNIASQKVLEKNGFKRIATGSETFEMNGQQLHFIYYALTSLSG